MKDLVPIAEQIAARLIERQADHRGRGILDRRTDLGGAARGARRSAYFLGGGRGLYPRRAADPDGYSR